MTPLVVERRAEQVRTTYTLRGPDGEHIDSLTFREVMALAAAAEGRVRAVWRRCYSPWFADQYLHVECDDHGVGHGTIQGLQGRWGRQPLLDPEMKAEGIIPLTPWGAQVLAEIREVAA
jgi:hypothetical protein